jgi:hypothetical protein
MWTAVALVVATSATPCWGVGQAVGPTRPLGVHGLSNKMAFNPELRSIIALRGWPDWAEEVEVDSRLPLATHEVRLYYMRVNRRIAFSEAYILGRPDIGLRLDESPIPEAKRAEIEEIYLAHDPARRAERAADRAVAAAESTERAADSIERAVARAERAANEMERHFYRSLRK